MGFRDEVRVEGLSSWVRVNGADKRFGVSAARVFKESPSSAHDVEKVVLKRESEG